MSDSYRAILVDGQLRWLDEVPDAIQCGTDELRVRVTIEDTDGQDEGELGTLLDDLAGADPYSDIGDPAMWQRGLRRE